MKNSGRPLSAWNPRVQEQIVASLHPAVRSSASPSPTVRLYPLAIWLNGYRVLSLNRILGRKWAAIAEKDVAKKALWRVLIVDGIKPSMPSQKMHVLISCYRCQLQDPDNCFVKPLVDQMRYAGLLKNDDPDSIALTVQQVKVATRKEEGTKIVLTEMLP